MFAYCRNNPVIRKDVSGTEDVCATDFNEDNNPLNDLGSPSGSGGSGKGTAPGTNVGTGTRTSCDTNVSDPVNDYLEGLGQNPSEVLKCFSEKPQMQVLTEDTKVFRVWGGTTSEYGHWVSPYDYGNNAGSMLSLPPGNTMTNTSVFVIPKGTIVLAGVASPLFGQPGGGIQWWIYRIECQSQM